MTQFQVAGNPAGVQVHLDTPNKTSYLGRMLTIPMIGHKISHDYCAFRVMDIRWDFYSGEWEAVIICEDAD